MVVASGSAEVSDAIGPEHSRQLAEHRLVVVHMLDDVHRHDQIEGCIGKRQGLGVGLRGNPTMLYQPGQRGTADLDEMGAGEGQARPQARPDLQTARTGGVQLADQRPGVEALGLDQVGVGPQRVVKAPVDFDGILPGGIPDHGVHSSRSWSDRIHPLPRPGAAMEDSE